MLEMVYFLVSDDKDESFWIVHESFDLFSWTNVGLLNKQSFSAYLLLLIKVCCLFANDLQLLSSVLLCLYVVLDLNDVVRTVFIFLSNVSFVGISQTIGKCANDKRSCLIDREEREDKVEVEVFEAKIEDASSFRVLSAYNDLFSFSEQSFIVYFQTHLFVKWCSHYAQRSCAFGIDLLVKIQLKFSFG